MYTVHNSVHFTVNMPLYALLLIIKNKIVKSAICLWLQMISYLPFVVICFALLKLAYGSLTDCMSTFFSTVETIV